MDTNGNPPVGDVHEKAIRFRSPATCIQAVRINAAAPRRRSIRLMADSASSAVAMTESNGSPSNGTPGSNGRAPLRHVLEFEESMRRVLTGA